LEVEKLQSKLRKAERLRIKLDTQISDLSDRRQDILAETFDVGTDLARLRADIATSAHALRQVASTLQVIADNTAGFEERTATLEDAMVRVNVLGPPGARDPPVQPTTPDAAQGPISVLF